MLEIVVVVALLLAIACAIYGFFAFIRETDEEKEVKAAAKEVSSVAKAAAQATKGEGAGLAANVQPHAAFSGPAEYLKALAAFSDSLSKLKRDVAAFVLAMGFLLIAAVGAGIEDKVKDQTKKNHTTTTTTP